MTDHDRDGIEARALLTNQLLTRVLDDMEHSAVGVVAANALSDDQALRIAACRLKVARDFKTRLILLSKKD